MIKIKIGMPHKALRPNARISWQAKLKPKKAARIEGYYAVFAVENNNRHEYVKQLQEHHFDDKRLNGIMTMYPKNSVNKMDLDNCLSACKCYIDGMCDALEINDKKIDWTLKLGECNKKNPHVEIVFSV